MHKKYTSTGPSPKNTTKYGRVQYIKKYAAIICANLFVSK